MITLFNDGILEAILYPNHWVYVHWLQNKHGRLQKTLIRDLIRIEHRIFHERLRGWFTCSEVNHSEFHRLLTRFGAMPREVVNDFQYFIKPILKESDLYVRETT